MKQQQENNQTAAERPASQTIYLDVEVYGGSEISTVCRDMCDLAQRLNIGVWASFNGKRVLAQPGDDWRAVCAGWYKACANRQDVCGA